MSWVKKLSLRLFPDKRPAWVQQQERDFIAAVNSLKTLHVHEGGRMSIDPEEIRIKIIEFHQKSNLLAPYIKASQANCQIYDPLSIKHKECEPPYPERDL
ncbi:hypothetical protein OI910_30875 [Pseudomonas aeruginosa]|nr:hypothetical protein OI910_30875 [Pseudomonas aeruginosa]